MKEGDMMKKKVAILVVGAIRETYQIIKEALKDMEITVMQALSGEEALSICMNHAFAVVFIDVYMPEINGFETAELLSEINKIKDMPIIFVGADDRTSLLKGYEVGGIDYVLKPIDPWIIKGKVEAFKKLFLQKKYVEDQLGRLESQFRKLVETQEMEQKSEQVSMEDSLTQVYNKRGIDRLLDTHWRNCLRYQLPLSVILFDLDHLKKYNNHYGHVKGDGVLAAVANAAKEVLYRGADFIGRYGGGAFIVVMPNTKKVGAMAVADRIHEVIHLLALPHHYNGENDVVTISSGVTTMVPTQSDVVSQLINKADEAMYKAKSSGRNQIKAWD